MFFMCFYSHYHSRRNCGKYVKIGICLLFFNRKTWFFFSFIFINSSLKINMGGVIWKHWEEIKRKVFQTIVLPRAANSLKKYFHDLSTLPFTYNHHGSFLSSFSYSSIWIKILLFLKQLQDDEENNNFWRLLVFKNSFVFIFGLFIVCFVYWHVFIRVLLLTSCIHTINYDSFHPLLCVYLHY